ncbi:MAG: cytochrome P450 [Xanthobacteraceae bacterium]
MDAAQEKPVRLTGIAALRWGYGFARDPLVGTRRAFEAFGPCVILAEGLPLLKRNRVTMLGVPLVLTAGAAFYSELMSRPDTWRGVNVLPGGPKKSAARRMSSGLMRLTGEQHAHYRKLLAAPLRRTRVEALTKNMARLAEAETASWPVGENIDLWEYVRRLMQGFAVEFLFGGTSEQSRTITEMGCRMMERKWDWRAMVPINLPITTYGQIVREAALLERRLLAWTAGKRGNTDEGDIASVIANSRDGAGNPVDDAGIVAQLPSLFGLSAEGGQSVLTWTLFLLMQHPAIAERLRDELHGKLGRTSPALDRAGELPYLDAVVKEAMRVLPPVPFQFRVAQQDATIAGEHVPKGTRTVLNTFLTNRSPSLYPESETFRPERWFTIAPTAFEFPVFGAGPHICPGHWFDSTAVKIAVAAIVARYGMNLLPGTRVDYRIQPTLRPRARLGAVFSTVNGASPTATTVTGKIRNLLKLPQ